MLDEAVQLGNIVGKSIVTTRANLIKPKPESKPSENIKPK
jgi:hypothetical protein